MDAPPSFALPMLKAAYTGRSLPLNSSVLPYSGKKCLSTSLRLTSAPVASFAIPFCSLETNVLTSEYPGLKSGGSSGFCPGRHPRRLERCVLIVSSLLRSMSPMSCVSTPVKPLAHISFVTFPARRSSLILP